MVDLLDLPLAEPSLEYMEHLLEGMALKPEHIPWHKPPKSQLEKDLDFVEKHFSDLEERTVEQKAERKQARMNACGMWASWVNPETGQKEMHPLRCGCWREGCQMCLERRMSDAKRELIEALESASGLFTLVVDDPDQMEGVDKSRFRRFPTWDGETHWVVDDPDQEFRGQRVGLRWLEEEADWKYLVTTPSDKRTSGSLGKPPPKVVAREEDTIEVVVEKIVPSGLTREQEDAAFAEAVEATKELDPHTEEELKEALAKRTVAYQKAIEKRGAVMYTWHEKVTVVLSRISWVTIRLKISETAPRTPAKAPTAA